MCMTCVPRTSLLSLHIHLGFVHRQVHQADDARHVTVDVIGKQWVMSAYSTPLRKLVITINLST